MFPDFRIIIFRSPKASLSKAMCPFHESLGADLLPRCVMRCTPTSWCTGSKKCIDMHQLFFQLTIRVTPWTIFSPTYRFDATMRYPHPVWPLCGRRASHRPCVWSMQLFWSTARLCKAWIPRCLARFAGKGGQNVNPAHKQGARSDGFFLSIGSCAWLHGGREAQCHWLEPMKWNEMKCVPFLVASSWAVWLPELPMSKRRR